MRGGKRPGAGRPAGSQSAGTRLNREFSAKALEAGISPLEVMLQTMREAWDKGDKPAACAIAKDAAPYTHPRLTAVDADINANVTGNYQPIPVAERDSLDAATRAAGGGDPQALG